MTTELRDATTVRPGAVHGKYVPGLPWDKLPRPIWEPEDSEPDPLEDEIRKLHADLVLAEDEQAIAEEEAREAEDRADDLRREADKLLDQLAKSNPRRVGELRRELDL